MSLHARLTILYASQTGNAESIAKGLSQEANGRGFDSTVYVADDWETADLTNNRLLAFVFSTTGDGEVPDNAAKFMRYLRKVSANDSRWSSVQYALLGLGDTNYANFCNGAKKLEERLKKVGAKPFVAAAFADDATGLEQTIDPWTATLWEAASSLLRRRESSTVVDKVATSLQKLAVEPTRRIPSMTASGLLPRHEAHNFGYLHIPGLPDLSQITTLSGLPKPTVTSVHVRTTASQKTVTPSLPAFYSQMWTGSGGKPLAPLTATNPLLASIKRAETLSTADAVKRTVQLELDVSAAKGVGGWPYKPGDAIGVVAPNPHDEALALATICSDWFSQQGEDVRSQVVEVQGVKGDQDLPMSLRSRRKIKTEQGIGHYYSVYEIFRYLVSVHSVSKKALLRALADMTTNEDERKVLLYLCSKEGSSSFSALRQFQPSLLQLCASCPGLKLDLGILLSLLAPLTPRYYSLTTTPLRSPNTLGVVFNVVRYDCPVPLPVKVHGLCTNWFDLLAGSPEHPETLHLTSASAPQSHTLSVSSSPPQAATKAVPVFPHPTPHFHLPHDFSVPLILIGPGTGVAPFMSFLRHRSQQLRLSGQSSDSGRFGKIWLFSGCRDPERDWLFRTEIEQFLQDGLLTQYHMAFSRVTQPKDVSNSSTPRRYVQDLLREHASELFGLLGEENARIYVCGDAKGMAKDVLSTVCDIVAEHKGVDRQAAMATITQEWMKNGKYLQDLWA